MKKEMLINVLQPEECRIAIVEDGILEELYVERTSHESYVGNIYKGRIVNIEPSIQAAFVDFGVGRNGFLHVSDVEQAYYKHLEKGRDNNDGGGRGGRGNGFRGQGGRRPVEDDEYPARRQAGPARRMIATPAEEPQVEEITHVEVIEEAAVAPEPYTPAPVAETPERVFGAGIMDAPVQRPPAETAPVIQEAGLAATGEGPASAGAEIASETEAATEAEPAKRRRSRGGRSRKPRGGEAEGAKETGTPPTEAGASEGAAEAKPSDSEKPKPMGSAERRTEAEDEGRHHVQTARTDESADARTDKSAESDAPVVENDLADEEDLVDDDLHEEPLPFGDDEEGEEETPRRHNDRQGGGRDGGRSGGRDSRGRRPGGPPNRRGPMGGRPGMGRPKPLIQDIFKRGQEVLVQVIKEGIGTKGPTLSTYISIAGRYLVLMPGLNRIGVSRKIADDEQRRRLREILNELQPPKGLGFIIRTAGLDRNKKELQRDLAYLSRLWQVVVRRIRKIKAPAEIYQESDMITRTIRDTFTGEIDTIWVDEPTAFEHAQEFLTIVMPRYASRINLYKDTEPMFHKYGIEDEISRIQRRHVPLPHGGSIVIDQTEALVAIDVNSGNFRADNNAEETAYQMNLQAAKEIARQLRLRDLGGVIVNDFIDMRDEKHRRGVERAMRDAVMRDRARTKILKISQFGIIEMTRQRIRPSLKRSVYQDCPHCSGTGQVKTVESMSIDVMRMIQLAAHRPNIQRINVRVHEEVANYLSNRKRKEITRLEEAGEIQVTVHGALSVSPEFLEFTCYDNNNEVKLMPHEETRPPRRR